jgi:hypothetical protein
LKTCRDGFGEKPLFHVFAEIESKDKKTAKEIVGIALYYRFSTKEKQFI